MKFYTLSIKAIKPLTPNSVLILFDIPENLKDVFAFKPGQYITLKAIINGEEVRRDYSICTTLKSGDLGIGIKAVINGAFSVYANSVLKPGDLLDVAPPNGRFVLEPNINNPRTIAAFAAGSGITPVMSVAKTLLEEETESSFILVYGNKTEKDAMFFTELQALKQKYGERLQLQFIFSQEQKDNSLFGRIETSTVNFVLKNKFKNFTISSYYLCGPEGMIKTVTEALKANGVAENNILFELFTAAPKSEAPQRLNETGTTRATILVDEEEFTIDAPENQSLLESAIKANIDVPYSCQGGICSSCIARLTEGKAEMRQNNILTDGELAEGLILTCQAHPKTANVTINYDDI